MKFTDLMIKNLQPKENRYELREADGFAVRVSTAGKKTWIFFYDFEGRRRRMTLGQYPLMKLKDARKKHSEALALLRNGKDPAATIIEAKKERLSSPTFEEFGNEYMEKWSKPNKRSWKEDQRQLDRYILPFWRRAKVRDLARRDISALLDPLAERAPVQANRTFALIRKIFNFAMQRGVIEISPCIGMSAPSKEKSKERHLSEEEIKIFWQSLESASMASETKRALKLILVTGQRPCEVAGMHRTEISGHWWTIPINRTKNEKEHRVYLSPLALKIIGDKDGYIFDFKNRNRPITAGALGMAVRRALSPDEKTGKATIPLPPFSPHDLRRTCATSISSLGHSAAVEKILNHTDGRVTSIYDRNKYDKEKLLALTAWSERITDIIDINAANKSILTASKLRVLANKILCDDFKKSELDQLAMIIGKADDNTLDQLLEKSNSPRDSRTDITEPFLHLVEKN